MKLARQPWLTSEKIYNHESAMLLLALAQSAEYATSHMKFMRARITLRSSYMTHAETVVIAEAIARLPDAAVSSGAVSSCFKTLTGTHNSRTQVFLVAFIPSGDNSSQQAVEPGRGPAAAGLPSFGGFGATFYCISGTQWNPDELSCTTGSS